MHDTFCSVKDDPAGLCALARYQACPVDRPFETTAVVASLLLVVRHLLLEAMHLFLVASCYY